MNGNWDGVVVMRALQSTAESYDNFFSCMGPRSAITLSSVREIRRGEEKLEKETVEELPLKQTFVLVPQSCMVFAPAVNVVGAGANPKKILGLYPSLDLVLYCKFKFLNSHICFF